MFDFNPLLEFSRAHCIAICGFLVVANLLLTLQTMILTGLHRSQVEVRPAALVACIPALVMILHVFAWFAIGVVMAPTFILLWLATTCLGINFWAIGHPQSMARLLRGGWSWATDLVTDVADRLSVSAQRQVSNK